MFTLLISGSRSLKELEMSPDSISAYRMQFRRWHSISQLSLSGNKLRKQGEKNQQDFLNALKSKWCRHIKTDTRPAQAQVFTWAKQKDD